MGAAGTAGKDGATGPNELASYSRVEGSPNANTSTASCESGDLVLGGGYELTDAEEGDLVTVDRFAADDTWTATVVAGGESEVEITAYAICATP